MSTHTALNNHNLSPQSVSRSKGSPFSQLGLVHPHWGSVRLSRGLGFDSEYFLSLGDWYTLPLHTLQINLRVRVGMWTLSLSDQHPAPQFSKNNCFSNKVQHPSGDHLRNNWTQTPTSVHSSLSPLQICHLYPNGERPTHTYWEIPTSYFSKWTYYLYLRSDSGSAYGELLPCSYLRFEAINTAAPRMSCAQPLTCMQKNERSRVRIISDINKEDETAWILTSTGLSSGQPIPYVLSVSLLVFLNGGHTLKKHTEVIQIAYKTAPPLPCSTPMFRSTIADLNKYN